MDLDFIRPLIVRNDSKIVLLVMDGLGGHPMVERGPTELEAANTPNLDALAERSLCGLQQAVAPGITPGSGPAHLSLFGYDPIQYQVGRGVLSALGIDFDLKLQDVAARGNFCTVDGDGSVTDRRAGRISTETNQELCQLLRHNVELPGVEFFIEPVKEYRFLLVLRDGGLSSAISDTDPLKSGKPPLRPYPRDQSEAAARTSSLVGQFVDQAQEVLAGKEANMVLLRGFSKRPSWPSIEDAFGLKAAAIAAYPMYQGVAKLVGMDILKTSDDFTEELDVLEAHWDEYDLFFIHVKRIDSAGEEGDFERKVKLIEEVDAQIPRLLRRKPDVLIVTGDHSTPTRIQYHSWHPVPVLIWSERCRPDGIEIFSERACLSGGLGSLFPAADIMPLALANALRLEKFGA